jgi:ATP-dependent exoDNAse (exonuclease V) beta subunit
MNGKTLTDQQARERIRNDFDTTFVVEAAAGTGKTSELIGRIVAGLSSGRVELSSTVAVTFTDFAAGELKLRLRGEIETKRNSTDIASDARKNLSQAIRELEEARIGTIHSFCADLLREHPVEAGIDPLFQVAPDDLTYPLFDVAFDRWFERQLENPGEGVRRILRRPPKRGFNFGRIGTLSQRSSESGPKRLLRRAALDLIKERDFTTPWRLPEGFDRKAQIDELVFEMRELGDWSDDGDSDQWFTKSLAYLKQFVSDITRVESLGEPRDYDGIEARLFGLLGAWKSKNYKAYFRNDNFPKDELRLRRDALKVRVQTFVDQAGADLAPRLREELWQVVEEFERLKARAGYLDFLDLLIRVGKLVRDNSDVRVDLQRRFKHIFVDEFQDTDPVQAEILMLLGADDPDESDWRKTRPFPGKLFIVGDPKQSIYRFRRADVALYQEVKQRILNSGGALLNLTDSFRSVPRIQNAVNSAFERVMSRDCQTQAPFVPLGPYRDDLSTQPAIVALPASQPYGDYGSVVDWKIEESLPGDVAAFVDWLVNASGWKVTEREHADVLVPIQPRHVCLLFRRFRSFSTDVTRPYVRALEAHRIPHLVVGGSSFHSREEVEAVRNALTAIEWPDDELAVYATLRGPLFAFTDAQLLAYRSRSARLHPFRRVPENLPESLKEIVDALAILKKLHQKRNYRPVADTVGNLLSLTRAHAGFANWPTGEQALANLMRLSDMARRTESNGLISFRGFVDWLEEQAESGEAGDAPIMEEGVDGVRIMTVHKAKGLEFPVVILADITAKETREASRWTDRPAGLSAMRIAGCTPLEVQEHRDDEVKLEKEEAARVLYVASTRARDLLVVCGVGDQPYEGWLSPLSPVIYPGYANSFNPQSTEPTGCPAFGQDTVIDRPKNASRPEGSVSPGLHRPQVGDHEVVWWDPFALGRSTETESGSRLTEFLREDESKVHAGEGIRVHADWQRNRKEVRENGSQPKWKVQTATSYAIELTAASELAASRSSELPMFDFLAPEDSLELPGVSVESIESDFDRPHGKRFGALVHAVLSAVALDADRTAIDAMASVQGRILGATKAEILGATETVDRALRHPLVRRAAAALSRGRCRREVPVLVKLDSALTIEGVVDLAFQEDGSSSWTIVDYKTGFEVEGRLHEYEKQVGLYALAISRATGEEVRASLLRV